MFTIELPKGSIKKLIGYATFGRILCRVYEFESHVAYYNLYQAHMNNSSMWLNLIDIVSGK